MKCKILIALLLVLFHSDVPIYAQSRETLAWSKMRPGDLPCWENFELGVTAEQPKALGDLHHIL